MHFSSALFATACLTVANGAVLGKRSLSGEATFYGGNVAGGACSFSTYTLPSNILGTALSSSNWDNSGNCGACIEVTGPSGNSVLAMIVDECPGCGLNHVDLFPDAFADLADPSKGIIDVTWEFVNCPITSPLEVHNKEGVSAFWFSMQVVNANKAVGSLDVSTDGGNTWQTTTRQTYNFFEQSSGFGTTTVDVKITSVDGDVVIVKNVEVSSGASTTASSNFGSSGTVASTSAAVKASTSSSEPTPTSTTPAVATASTSEVPVATSSTSAAPAVVSTTSEAPTATPTTSEAPVAITTSEAGANFIETRVSESPAAATLATYVIPSSSAAAAAGMLTTSSPTPTSYTSSAKKTVTVTVDACEATSTVPVIVTVTVDACKA